MDTFTYIKHKYINTLHSHIHSSYDHTYSTHSSPPRMKYYQHSAIQIAWSMCKKKTPVKREKEGVHRGKLWPCVRHSVWFSKWTQMIFWVNKQIPVNPHLMRSWEQSILHSAAAVHAARISKHWISVKTRGKTVADDHQGNKDEEAALIPPRELSPGDLKQCANTKIKQQITNLNWMCPSRLF